MAQAQQNLVAEVAQMVQKFLLKNHSYASFQGQDRDRDTKSRHVREILNEVHREVMSKSCATDYYLTSIAQPTGLLLSNQLTYQQEENTRVENVSLHQICPEETGQRQVQELCFLQKDSAVVNNSANANVAEVTEMQFEFDVFSCDGWAELDAVRFGNDVGINSQCLEDQHLRLEQSFNQSKNNESDKIIREIGISKIQETSLMSSGDSEVPSSQYGDGCEMGRQPAKHKANSSKRRAAKRPANDNLNTRSRKRSRLAKCDSLEPYIASETEKCTRERSNSFRIIQGLKSIENLISICGIGHQASVCKDFYYGSARGEHLVLLRTLLRRSKEKMPNLPWTPLEDLSVSALFTLTKVQESRMVYDKIIWLYANLQLYRKLSKNSPKWNNNFIGVPKKSFSSGEPHKWGNPINSGDTEVSKAMLHVCSPDLKEGDQGYEAELNRVKRMQQLMLRLYPFAEKFGDGIFILSPLITKYEFPRPNFYIPEYRIRRIPLKDISMIIEFLRVAVPELVDFGRAASKILDVILNPELNTGVNFVLETVDLEDLSKEPLHSRQLLNYLKISTP